MISWPDAEKACAAVSARQTRARRRNRRSMMGF
jgi:hypothetical protein